MLIYEIPGLHSSQTAKNIKEKLDGKTYMDFEVQFGGYGAMNQTVSIVTNYETTQKEFEDFVLYVAFSELGR